MIFLTDGEEQIITRSQVAEAVKLLLERKDIAIYIIGIGDPQKASPIPKKDKAGNVIGLEATEDGETIYTRPNPKFLKEITNIIGGEYRHDATGEELRQIFEQIIGRHKNVIGVKEDHYQRRLTILPRWRAGIACTVLALVAEGGTSGHSLLKSWLKQGFLVQAHFQSGAWEAESK